MTTFRKCQVHILYTEYVGCAITAAIPVKFGNAHGRSRPEVGSGFPIDAYGSRGVSSLFHRRSQTAPVKQHWAEG